MYISYTSYVKPMEHKVMDIGTLRRHLGERIEAAHFGGEATLIRHGKRGDIRAALVPASWVDELMAYRAAAEQATRD